MEREEVDELECDVGDWRPDLVKKTAENISLDFDISCMCWERLGPLQDRKT